MIKYSMIIPIYALPDNNFAHCIQMLTSQTYKNFEVLVCGIKVLPFEDTIINGIRIRNIEVKDINRSIGKLMNIGVKESKGEYIHVWLFDNLCYEDYFKRLNFYVDTHGENVLYGCKQIVMRPGNVRHHNFFFESPTLADGCMCIHRKHLEPFYEGFIGYSHVFEEWLYRMWKKLTFICLDIDVVHMPHFPRALPELISREAYNSTILLEKMRALNFEYDKYDKL